MKVLTRDPNFYTRRLKQVAEEKERAQKQAERERKLKVQTFRQYETIVRKLTENQPLYLLDNFEKRAWEGYHVDHVISVWFGYDNNIPAEVIADISNLQIINWTDNKEKGRQCYCIVESCRHMKLLNHAAKHIEKFYGSPHQTTD